MLTENLRRIIVIADTLYHRYVGLSDIFYKKFNGNPVVDIFDHYNEKKITRKGAYRNALVIGNQSLQQMEQTNHFLRANNRDIIIYRIFFSDMIKLRKLKRHLVISPYCIVVSSDISNRDLFTLSHSWLGSVERDDCVFVRFNPHERQLLQYWEEAMHGHIPSGLRNMAYSVISRLKRKMDIRSEYSLYLLWRITHVGIFHLNNFSVASNSNTVKAYVQGRLPVTPRIPHGFFFLR